MTAEDDRVWARCRAGKRWFWCVWIMWTDNIIAHGRADSPEDCERQAIQYGPVCEERAGFAENRRRQLAAIRRQEAATSRQQSTSDAAMEEFVFVPFHDDDSGCFTRHRIVKRTEATIFVEEEGEACRADGQLIRQRRPKEDWRAWSMPMIALDRKAMEQDGSKWHRGSRERYWVSMERWRQENSTNWNRIPDCLIETLGLSGTSTKEEARARFKKLLAASHPDRGGSSEGFQKLNALKHEYPNILA